MCARVVDKKEKKDQIITAAVREFAKKGFAKTTINDIAEAAGIGKGTVYEYFKNKEEIINSAFAYFMHSMQFDIQAILIAETNAKEKIEQTLDLFSDMNNWSTVEFIELMFDFWAEGIKSQDSRGGLLKDMDKFYHSYREIFADIIVQGMSEGIFKKNINPGYVAAVIIGALDGLILQWVLDKANVDFAQAVKTIKSLLLKGILLPTPGETAQESFPQGRENH